MSDRSLALNLGPHEKYPKSVKAGIPKLANLKSGWNRVPIGHLFDEVSRPVDMKDDQVYDLVTVKRARGGVVKRESLPGKKIAVKSQFYVHEGDFLVSKRQIAHGACGFVPKNLDRSIVSNEYSVLKCNKNILPLFLNYLMHTTYFQQTCFHSSIGVHIEKMIFKLEDWFRWKIDIPSAEEQEKIASFLSTVDKKINQLCRKRNSLITYKRGAMQKIFSHEIRFNQDSGAAFPDWKKERLKNVANVNPRVGELPEAFKYIDLESVNDGVLNSVKEVSKYDAPSRAQRTLTKKDILFQTVRPYQKNNLFFELEGTYVASTGYAQIRTELVPEFLYQLVHIDSFLKEVIKRCTGTSYPAINSNDLEEIHIEFPAEKEEQQKIADYLSTIDTKIDAVTQQITKMETFKKGLLQKMFA